jgi:CRP/FNR family transcriptional regulator, cyclic AMP receptor protein
VNMRRLAELPLFEGLDDDAIRAVGNTVTEESVEAGRIIVREGDYATDLTIIDEGTARVEHDGRELATLGPGEMFGEMGVLHKDQRNATVVATTDMRLIHMTSFDIKRLRGRYPEIMDRIQRTAEQRAAG